MSLFEQMQQLPPDEQAAFKAANLADRPVPPTFEAHGLEIMVLSMVADGKDLIVELAVYENGQPLNLGDENPFIFRNPPIMVPDSAGGYIEDLDQALVEMISEVIYVTQVGD